MIDTDDKMSNEVIENGEGQVPSNADILPSSNENEISQKPTDEAPDKAPDKKSSFIVDTVCFSIKVIAVALSLFVLIVSILTVAMPLSAMRVFNDMGMYERALNSGDRYIIGRLESADVNRTDANGEYVGARSKKELADADMLEALDVCINLSDKLMREYLGNDKKSTTHFADMLDKYIRIYMSLNGENATSRNKSNASIKAMPRAYHPFVYDYKHTLMTLDYAARVYSGDPKKLRLMMYDNNGNAGEEFMWSLTDYSHNIYSVVLDENTAVNLRMSYIDRFIDYIDQLSTYIGIRLDALGITGTLSESEAKEKYVNVLKGDEFSLFVTPQNGFTQIYNQLKSVLTKYAQLAYDFTQNPDNTDYELHRLYWLQVLTSATDRIWNMGVLLNYSNSAYGQHWKEVYDEYGSFAFHNYRNIIDRYDDGEPHYSSLGKAFDSALSNYLIPSA